VGPPQILAKVAVRTKELGLPTHITDITGKSHNPENTDLAKEMIILLSQHPELQLPSSAILRTTIRSNIHGNKLDRESVMEDMVTMMLASRCEWHNLVCRVAEDLKASKQPTHGLVVFGMDDCVPLSPFHKLQVKVSKFEVRSLSFEDEPGESKQKAMPASPNLPGTSIAIVGASCRLPGANDLEEIWQLVSEQRDCLQRCPRDRFNADESFRVSQSGAPSWMKNLHGNFIDVLRFDHSFFGINAKEAANMDPQQRLLLELSYEALDASGYLATHVRERGDAVGCFVGASMVEYLDNTNAHPPTAYTSTGTIRGFLCGKLSYYYGWTGPSEVIDTACSSSLVAIHRACTALLMGECKIALAGGVNAMTGINNFLDLGKAGFLSPTGQCKAFDVSADGYCRAEGAGLVVLKTLKQAMADGDDILGIIPGIATNQGGLSTTMTVPSSQALQSLYQRLLVKAGLSPSQVSYVEAHATGTQAGDPIEMESIRAVFSDSSRSVPLSIGSIKGNIGHCETAAGVAGLLKVLAMIRHKAIPPQANYRVLNPKIPALDQDGLTIPRHVVTWDAPVRTALVNSYGAAGSNCALLCSEMVKETASMSEVIVRKQGLNIPMILSAASVKSLISYSHKIAEYLSHQKSEAMLVDVAFTLNHRRKNHKFCLEIKDTRLEDVVQSFGAASVASFEWPNKPRPVVLVFGGQNDNKISINRAFVDAYPAFRSHLDSCDSALIKAEHLSLYPGIFQDLPDSGVIVQQCSLFAIQYACARCWIDAGLEIGGIVGHSLGEYAALVISGVLSLADGMKLVASRATLIDIEWGEDKGGMLAISATSSQVDRLLEQVRVQSISRDKSLVIACYNALRSTVISGSSASIDLAEQLLVSDAEFAGIRYQRLSTTHAFHSPLVEPILDKLDGIAATLEYSQPELPLEFCTTDAIHSIHQWSASKHAREPVYFHKAVRRIEQRLGSCVWLEAGVDTCAIPLVRKATLNDVAHSYHHIDTKTCSEPCNTIGDTISAFWRHGISLKHWAFLNTPPKQVWLPPYQFEKSSHGIENIDRAMEAHKKLSEGATIAPESARPLPRQLVKHVETTTNHSTFLIDSQCERYSKVVGGHAVVGYPLCPASMYMECVVMAVQSLSDKSDNQNLLFEDVEFSAPLGLSPNRKITIQIVKTSESLAWNFMIHSNLLGSTSTATLHCAGKVTFSQKTSLASFARLLGEPQERLLGSESAEKLKRARAYSLFSKVVHYETFLQGISSVVIDNNEALAIVQLAVHQPGQDESTAWRQCDAPLLDGFISVAGLLLNSSDLVSSEHVMVAGAVEHTIITASCTATNLGPWQVYAKYIADGARIVSDVFVYDSQRRVVAMFGGVRFTKVQLSQLRKTLSSLGGTQSAHQVKSRDVHSAPSSVPSESVGTTIHTPDTDIDSAPQPLQRNNSSNPKGNKEGHFRKILSDYIGMDDKDIPSDVVLIDLGVDSLSSLELASDIATRFGLVVDSFDLQQMTLTIILAQIDGTLPIVVDRPSAEVRETDASPEVSLQHPTTVTSTSHHCASEPIAFRRPFEALTEAEAHFDQIALAHGYTDYWSKVAPLQSELLIAYILEAFLVLGVDIASIPLGEPIPPIKHLPKHELLMKRLWEILQDAGIVHLPSDTPVKGPSMPSAKTSWNLDRDFLQKYPRYSSEARLMKITGERLADCLQGRQDPVALMFGSEASSEAMEEYYHQSPMLSTSTDMLVTYVLTLLRSVNTTRDHPLRILEAGAGTGGTTIKLAEALSKAGITCEYTFTDISPVLVAKAKSKFAKYPWMSFTTLNLEEEMRHDFRSRYHIVISTNCVHATRSRATSCCRLKDALAEQGILILSEVTQTIEWYDLCFGLLDGWWLAGNGTEYPLQPARVWMDALSESCFASFGYSKGLSRESTTQQLLVGVVR
jgi:acyl transferase domain-containing protein/acyl carrier protein/SAM-dependent methyltransferase